MKPVSKTPSTSDYKSQVLIGSLWRGYQVRKHFLPSDVYLASKLFLENCPNLEQLPRASSGSAPVYYPPNLSVVFKKSGKIKSLVRFNTMCEIRNFCERQKYANLIIPKARPYGDFIIEERLPIVEGKQKRQVGLYCENKEKFSLAVKEFTKLLCQTDYPDILTSTHPYQQGTDIPLARYDNIPLFLENEKGMIGLIDLEDVKIRSKSLSKEEVLEVSQKAVFLFPYHLNEVLSVVRDLFPEMDLDFSSVLEQHVSVLRNFNAIYIDHISFVLEKKSKLEVPLVSESRKNEIKVFILDEFKDLNLMDKEIVLQLEEQLIQQIELNIKKSIGECLQSPSSNINLADSRTLSLSIKNILLDLPLDGLAESVIKAVLEELKKGSEICYANLYYNHAGEFFVKIHF